MIQATANISYIKVFLSLNICNGSIDINFTPDVNNLINSNSKRNQTNYSTNEE